jgi:Acetyltransferases
MNVLNIRKAEAEDSNIITNMVVLLLSELSGSEVDSNKYRTLSSKLFDNPDVYSAFLAFNENDQCIGILTATESWAIYAGGSFGVIHELYVIPQYRSKNVGHELMKELVDFAKTRNWTRIEVGAPNEDEWERTIQFYEREGFKEIGPRLKLVL